MNDAPPLLELTAIRKEYALRGGWFRRRRFAAVDDVSLAVRPGEILGIVGESGCGKSTLAAIMVGLLAPTAGSVAYRRADGTLSVGSRVRPEGQMVFQDNAGALNRRKRVGRVLAEGLAARGVPASQRTERVSHLLRQVGLEPALRRRLPHELSGGQRQRVGIARALAMEPALLVADEPVSSLDVSLQGQVINLLMALNRDAGLTIVLISHDLPIVMRACGRIAVMRAGRLVEIGSPASFATGGGAHPYTRALLAAVPRGLAGRMTP